MATAISSPTGVSHGSPRRQLVLTGVAAGLPLIAYLVTTRLRQIPVSRAMFVIDFISFSYLYLLLIRFQRRPAVAVIPFVLAACTLWWTALEKMAILGLWIRAGDLTLVDESFAVLSFSQQVAAVTGAITILSLIAINFHRPRLGVLARWATPLALVVAFGLIAPGPTVGLLRATTRARYGNDPLYRSPLFAVAYDLLETLQFRRQARTLLAAHRNDSPGGFVDLDIPVRRNVHLLLMESLMDPYLLGIELAEDPVDARIRRWLGGSALSPVFAGRSAQAEFELLCGSPAYDRLDPVTFNDLRGGPLPCLPRALAAVGYATVASVDIPPNFFNARVAYRSLGFATTYFRPDLPRTDLDGPWLSSDQQIEFNKAHLRTLGGPGAPVFNYVFFTTGHIPYLLNPERRPEVLVTGSTAEVTRFVNAVLYNTRSVADYVEHLLVDDPDSLIVVTGDHQGSLRSIQRSHAREHAFDRYLVPYLVLDRGQPLQLGDLAHYDIPHLIVATLTGQPFATSAAAHGLELIRPVGDRTLYRAGGAVRTCPSAQDPFCGEVERFRQTTLARWQRWIELSRRPPVATLEP